MTYVFALYDSVMISKLTEDWQPYDGDYEKEIHAIKTKDGREFISCWPNAGKFCCQQTGVYINEDDVVEVKIGVHPMDFDDAST